MKALTNRKYYRKMSLDELIEQAQKDDFSAIEELIKRQQNSVYATFYYLDPRREDLLDLTQEALFKMSKGIKNLRNPKTFKSWLNQIISNLFYDVIRKKVKTPNIISTDTFFEDNLLDITMDIPCKKKEPSQTTLGNELNDVIKSSIHRLPEQFRLAIVLREMQGLSYEEIAEITNSSVGTVKSRIARARGKLQEYLKPYIA